MPTSLNEFPGTWACFESENFEEFLKEMGAPWIARKAATSVTTQLIIALIDEDTITIDVKAGPMTQPTMTFKMGNETMNKMQGDDYKTPTKFQNGQIIAEFLDIKGVRKPQTVIREIVDGILIQTIKVEKITCVRKFKKTA